MPPCYWPPMRKWTAMTMKMAAGVERSETASTRTRSGRGGGFMSMLMNKESSCLEEEDNESSSRGGDDDEEIVGEEGRDKAAGDARHAGATGTLSGQCKNRGGNPCPKNQQSPNSSKARNVDDDVDDEEEEDLDSILFDMSIHVIRRNMLQHVVAAAAAIPQAYKGFSSPRKRDSTSRIWIWITPCVPSSAWPV